MYNLWNKYLFTIYGTNTCVPPGTNTCVPSMVQTVYIIIYGTNTSYHLWYKHLSVCTIFGTIPVYHLWHKHIMMCTIYGTEPIYHLWYKYLYTIYGTNTYIPSMVRTPIYHLWYKHLFTTYDTNTYIPSMLSTPVYHLWYKHKSECWAWEAVSDIQLWSMVGILTHFLCQNPQNSSPSKASHWLVHNGHDTGVSKHYGTRCESETPLGIWGWLP